MKLMDKLVDKFIEPKGIALKDYKKYQKSNMKKVDRIINMLQNSVTEILNEGLLSNDKINKLERLKSLELKDYIQFFGSENHANIFTELNFCFRVYANRAMAKKMSEFMKSEMFYIMENCKDFAVLLVLVLINNQKPGNNVVWNGQCFEGDISLTGIDDARYVTSYVGYINELIKAIDKDDKTQIEIATKMFDTDDLGDYRYSIFPEFPSKYDMILQKIRENNNGNDKELN